MVITIELNYKLLYLYRDIHIQHTNSLYFNYVSAHESSRDRDGIRTFLRFRINFENPPELILSIPINFEDP